MDVITVKEIMTKEAVSVHPETSLVEVARLLTEHKFNGLPVVDKDNRLIGLINEYNLISGQMSIHLPTLQAVLGNLSIFGKDKSSFAKNIESVSKLTAKDVMNNDPLAVQSTASYDEVVRIFQAHHAVNPIPVVDPQRKLVGVVSRYDVLKPIIH